MGHRLRWLAVFRPAPEQDRRPARAADRLLDQTRRPLSKVWCAGSSWPQFYAALVPYCQRYSCRCKIFTYTAKLPHMTKDQPNSAYQRVRARLDELFPEGKSDRAASLEASDGRDIDLVRNLKRGRSTAPRGDSLRGLAKLLQRSTAWILGDDSSDSDPVAPEASTPDARIIDLPPPMRSNTAVPVLGTALGSVLHTNGERGFEGFTIDMIPVQYARLPEGLAGQRDIYAIFVEGDSMDPMHPPGQIRFVQPHRPPAPGDTVVLQTRHWEYDPGQAYIKIFRRRSGGKVILEQINPRATLEVPAEFIIAIHRVATDNDLFLI